MTVNAESTDAVPGDVQPAIARAFSDELELAYTYVDRLSLELCLRIADEVALLSRDPEPIDRLIGRVGVADQALYVVQAVLDILAEAGFARLTDRGWKRLEPWPADRSVETAERAREVCPRAGATFGLIERCRAEAASFLDGRTSGLAAIFPRGDLTPWQRLHDEDMIMSIYADLVVPALRAAIRPRVRVLEVGGGVGAVLDRCMSLLETAEVGEYRFTDVGQVFVHAAQDRYRAAPWLHFSLFDVDRPLEDQGLAAGTFDVVVAVNVMHVARDLGFSLRELRRALRPHGSLILAEGSPPNSHHRWSLDVVFGFLRGWWDVGLDDLRPRPGFMLPSEWGRALRACGYAAVSQIPGERWFAGPCRGGLIVANAPGRPVDSGELADHPWR